MREYDEALGGVNKRLHKTPMVFAKSVGEGSTASFKVRMRKMYLRQGNDQSVMGDSKSKNHLLDISEDWWNGDEMYSFDSGTELSDEFREIWREVTGMDCTNNPILVLGTFTQPGPHPGRGGNPVVHIVHQIRL